MPPPVDVRGGGSIGRRRIILNVELPDRSGNEEIARRLAETLEMRALQVDIEVCGVPIDLVKGETAWFRDLFENVESQTSELIFESRGGVLENEFTSASDIVRPHNELDKNRP
jgi:hypothetical protein